MPGGEKLSIPEFASKIKEKYPEYKDVDDTLLTQKIIDKYPEYKEKVNYQVKSTPTLPSVQEQTGFAIHPVGTYQNQPVSHELPQANGDIQTLPQVSQPKKSQQTDQALGVRNEAIKNTARIKFKNLGITADENSLPFKKEVSDLTAKHDNGETEVTMKNGKPVLGRSLNGWDSYLKGLRENKSQNDEAIKLMDASDEEAIKILDEKSKQPEEYLPPTASGVSGYLGHMMGGMTRMIKNQGLGAMAGEVVAGAMAPETGGASLALIPLLTGAAATIPEFRRLAYSNELQKRYSQLIQEGKSKNEAYQLAKESAKGAGMAGAGEALAFSMAGQAASKFIPAASSELKGATGAIKGVIKGIAPEALGQSAVSASSAVAKDLYAKHLGIDVTNDEIKHDALDNASDAMKTFGLMGIFHAAANGLIHLPGYAKSQIKNALSTVPPEQMQQVYGEMEQKGLVPKGSSQKPLEELDNFAAAKQQVPTGYSEDQTGSLAGLVELKNKLKKEHLEELQKTDPSFHSDLQQNFDTKISSIYQQIEKIKKADNPLDHEVDDATGEVVGTKAAVIMPGELNKPHTEITIAPSETIPEEEKRGAAVILPKMNDRPKENLLKSENNQPEYKPTINDAPFVDRHFSEEEKSVYAKLDEDGKEKMIDDKREELKNISSPKTETNEISQTEGNAEAEGQGQKVEAPKVEGQGAVDGTAPILNESTTDENKGQSDNTDKQGDIEATNKVEPDTKVSEDSQAAEGGKDGVRISKSGLAQEQGFSKEFESKGGGEVANGVLNNLKSASEREGIPLNKHIENQVNAMKGKINAPTEHNIITAGAHLLNIDRQIKEAIANKRDIKDLQVERDQTAAVLRQLGNTTGRNLGLFNLVFKDVSDSGILVAKNAIKERTGIQGEVPESMDELRKSSLTSEDKKKVEPYVKKIEEYKKEQAKYEAESASKIQKYNDDEVLKAIKEAHEAGKKEGLSQAKDKPAKEKKSQQLKDLAKTLRTSDEMDKFLKGSQGNIEKAGIIDLGSYKEILANIIEGAAIITEGVEKVNEYIKNAIDKVKDVDKRKLLEDVQMLMSKAMLPEKEKSIEEINKIAENENAKTITKSMVDKGLIKNVVDHVIHSNTPYDKVIDEATKELQHHLPNVTKENVADAFTRRNEFALEKKNDIENTVKQKRQDVQRLTVKEGRLRALENAEDYHSENDKAKREILKSDYEKEVDEKIANLKKEKADAEKELKEPPTHEDRLNDAKDAVNKRIEAIRKEIADKERKLEKDKLHLHEDEELRRLKEVEKSLSDLRDKYLPKEPKKFADEKELKRRRVSLNKEISDLNDQINAGERKSKSAKVEDTEHIKQLKKIRDTKKELLDKVAPDYEKLKKQQDAKDAKLKKRLAEIQKETDYVNAEKRVYQQAIKDPVKANEQLKAARELRDKTYAENGLRVEKNARQPIKVDQEYQRALKEIEGNDKLTDTEKNDKIAELKAQRDSDLSGTKQGVISHLHDDIADFQKDLTVRANDAEAGSKELKDANDLKAKLENIRKVLDPTGEHLEDVANKAHDKIIDLLNDKDLSKEDKAKLNEIKGEFEKNNQLTSDELANKRIKKQLEKDIINNERKIKSGIYTEMPTTAYDFRRSDELNILHNNRDITAKKFNLLAAHANEKNKTLADKIMDASSKLLVSGVETVGKVAEAGSFKPIMDSIVESTTGQIVGGLTGAPTTTLKALKHGYKTYGAFATKAAAEAHIAKLANIKEDAITKLENANKTGDEKRIKSAMDEFKKADLNYGISLLYRGIDANSLTTFWQYIAHGATDFDEQIGKAMKKDISDYRTKLEKTGYVLEGWVRSHGALKTSLSARNAVMRSYASTLQHFQREGLPLDENSLALAHIIAVNDYEAGKLSNKTSLSKTISAAKSSENMGKRLAAKFAFAVSTIAINIAKRGVDYSSLGIEGLARMAHGTAEGMRLNKTEGKIYDTWMEKVADGYKQIPLQERLYINGVISRGMFGAGLGMVSLVGLSAGNIKYGGTYEDRKKRKIIGSDGQPLKPDEWEFNGWRAPKLVNAFINHVPEMLPIALAADAYNIHTLDKEGAQKDENYALSTIREIVARLPFQTVAGIVSSEKPIQSTVDRVTRIPAAKNVEGWIDPKERENLTLGERIKNNTGLGFLNPEKGGKFTKDTPAGKFIQESNLNIPAIHEDNYKYPGGVDASHPNGKANKEEAKQIKDQHDNLFEAALNQAIKDDYFAGMTYKEKQEELNAMSSEASAKAKEIVFKDVEPNELESDKKAEKSQKRKDFYERAFPQ